MNRVGLGLVGPHKSQSQVLRDLIGPPALSRSSIKRFADVAHSSRSKQRLSASYSCLMAAELVMFWPFMNFPVTRLMSS